MDVDVVATRFCSTPATTTFPASGTLTEPRRLGHGGEACSLMVAQKDRDYGVDERGWKPAPPGSSKGRRCRVLPGADRAEHNMVVDRSRFPKRPQPEAGPPVPSQSSYTEPSGTQNTRHLPWPRPSATAQPRTANSSDPAATSETSLGPAVTRQSKATTPQPRAVDRSHPSRNGANVRGLGTFADGQPPSRF